MQSNNGDQLKVDQDRWVVHIKHCLQIICEQEQELENCVCVFGVPKELLAVKPEVYIPQCVSIGPYHHWISKLLGMERYKFAAARRFLKTISGDCKFESVVEEVKKYDVKIRSCYQKCLDYKEEALAWLMALDASFLLESLQFDVQNAYRASSQVSFQTKRLSRILDPSGRSAIHNEIMRDLVMLENQLPSFLLQKLLEMQLGSKDKAEEKLSNLLCLVCEKWSPFMFKMQDSSRLLIKERGHVLEVLYYSIVPEVAIDNAFTKENADEKASLPDLTFVERVFKALWKAVSSLNIGPVRHLSVLSQHLLKSRFLQCLMQLFMNLVSIFRKPSIQQKDENDEERAVQTPPTRDELEIPSVSDLYSAGVKFVPTDGDLATIRFDTRTATLYLPKLRLDSNTEVVLRNLVAFEASAAPGALIFSRYTDFMNGIIDTDEDVRLLRKSGILYNHLADDGKVASMWNGLGKCVKLTQVKYLDEVIADVNKYYHKRWSVAVKDYIKKYIFGSWQLLTLLASVILLLLTCLQAFCSVYDCKRWWSDTQFMDN